MISAFGVDHGSDIAKNAKRLQDVFSIAYDVQGKDSTRRKIKQRRKKLKR